MEFSHNIAKEMLSFVGKDIKPNSIYSKGGNGYHKLENGIRYKISAVKEEDLNKYTLIIRDNSGRINHSLVVFANGEDITFIKAIIRDNMIHTCLEAGNSYGFPNCKLSLVKGEFSYLDKGGELITKKAECDFLKSQVGYYESCAFPNDEREEIGGFIYTGFTYGSNIEHILKDEGIPIGDFLLHGLRHPVPRQILNIPHFTTCRAFPGLERLLYKSFPKYKEAIKGRYVKMKRFDENFNRGSFLPSKYHAPSESDVKKLLYVPGKKNNL